MLEMRLLSSQIHHLNTLELLWIKIYYIEPISQKLRCHYDNLLCGVGDCFKISGRTFRAQSLLTN